MIYSQTYRNEAFRFGQQQQPEKTLRKIFNPGSILPISGTVFASGQSRIEVEFEIEPVPSSAASRRRTKQRNSETRLLADADQKIGTIHQKGFKIEIKFEVFLLIFLLKIPSKRII